MMLLSIVLVTSFILCMLGLKILCILEPYELDVEMNSFNILANLDKSLQKRGRK